MSTSPLPESTSALHVETATEPLFPVTLEEMKSVEKTVRETALPLPLFGTVEVEINHDRYEVNTQRGVSLIRVNRAIVKRHGVRKDPGASCKDVDRDVFVVNRKPWFTHIDFGLVSTWAEAILKKTWDSLHLDLLSSENLHPMIAGGWIEGTVQNGILKCILIPQWPESLQSMKNPYTSFRRMLNRDVDVFLSFNEEHSEEAIDAIVRWCEEMVGGNKSNGDSMALGPSSVTVVASVMGEEHKSGHQVQIIPVRNRTLEDVINSFDLDCCCAYYVKPRTVPNQTPQAEVRTTNPPHREGLVALQRAVDAWRRMENVFRPSRMTAAFERRVVKYLLRGYDLVFPYEYHFNWEATNKNRVLGRHGNVSDLMMVSHTDAYCLERDECDFGIDVDVRTSSKTGEDIICESYLTTEVPNLMKSTFKLLWKRTLYLSLDGRGEPYSYFKVLDSSVDDRMAFYHGLYKDSVLYSYVEAPDLIVPTIKGLQDKWHLGPEGDDWVLRGRCLGEKAKLRAIEMIRQNHQIISIDSLVRVVPPISDRHSQLRSKQQNEDWFFKTAPTQVPVPATAPAPAQTST